MFSFFRDNLEQTQRICDAIIKIYGSPIQSPKYFYQNNPKLKIFSELLEPPAYKQKQLQEIIKDKITRPFDLEIILGTELELNQQLPDNWYEIFAIYSSEPNNDSSGKEFIFQFAERVLIKANYQLKYLVNFFNINPNINNDSVLTHIPKLLTFFWENSDYMNQTFFDILSSLYGHVNHQWKSIFYNNSYVLRKFASSLFVSASKLVPYESHNTYNASFSFIKDVFSQSYRYYTDFYLRPQLLIEFQRSLIYIVEKSTNQQKTVICQMICNLLQEAPTFFVDFINALLNLTNCVRIYKSCLIGLETEKIISTFQIILEYVVWVIMKFPESSILHNPTIRFPKVSFSNIDINSYMKKTVILPQKVKSVLNPSFDCIPSTLSEIIESNEETKVAILKDMRDYLIKCQPTINWDHFSSQIFKSNVEEEDSNEKSTENSNENKNQTQTKPEKNVKNETDNHIKTNENMKLTDKNDLDNESSDYWTPVKEIQFSDDSDTPSEYSHFRALLCFFIEVTKKINDETIFNFYFSNFEEFKKDWAPLFLTYIYPTNSYLIGHLLFKCFKSIPKERKLFLDEIAFLIDNRNQQKCEVSLLVFIPLINLLFIEFPDFGSTFVSSQLLKSLIRESKKSNRFFLLLSSIIYKYPIECFTSSILTNFITDSFDDPSFHKTFVKCLINGLKYCGQKKDSTEIRLLLNHLTALLPTLLAKKYKKSYDLIDILANTIPSFDNDNISLFFQIRILDLVADSCKNDPSEKMFRSAFQFFIALSRTSNQNLIRMSNPKSSIFSTFTEIFEKNHFEFDIVDVLFDFAIIPYKCSSFVYFKDKESIINSTFVNPMAITLIFKWIEGRDNESEIVQSIYLMTNAHVVNAFQLQKANIPMIILTRISKINSEIELVNRYFDLLYSIWKQGMPISDAYSAISTMKTIRFPHLIIDSFFRLLRQDKKNHNIFYWLNGINSGFSGTKITFDKSIDTLFISFQFYVDETTSQNKTLVFIQNEKEDVIEFGIRQTRIYFDYNGLNKSYFRSEILVNVWHHITFAINCKKIRMILCEKFKEQKTIKVSRKKSLRFYKEKKAQDETAIPEDLYDPEVFTCPSFFSQSINLYIGRRNDKINLFSGLIESIFVFNDYISYTNYLQLSKLTLMNNEFPHLIASYVPRIVEDSDTIHISKDLTAEFHGLTLTSYQTIHNVITNTNVLDCLLPFYNKIISCKFCKGTEEYCMKCGRLEKEYGRKLLYSLTSIIAHLLKINNCIIVNKAPHSIIELLSQYFTKIDTIFYTNEFVSTFKSLFEIAQSKDLELETDIGQKMVEEIWLNYEMISRFPPELQMRYFSTDLVKVFVQDEDNYKLFNSFTSYDFLIHKLLLFFTNNDLNVAKIAWQITLECILKNSMTTATASALLGLSFSPETAPVSEPIVNFIDLLEKTSNSHMISALQIFNSLLPFAIWASRPPLQSQRKSLNYIIGQNNRSADEIKTALMQVAFLYEPPTPADSLFQTVLRHFQNGCNEIYPLLIRAISKFPKKDLEANSAVILSVISPEKYSKIPLFAYLVLSLAEVYLKQEVKNINFSQIFGKYITLEFIEKRYESLEKLQCLIMLYEAEKKINFSDLSIKTLEFLFDYYQKNNEKNTEILGQIFGSFFVRIFFKSEISLSEPEDNFLTKYSDHFCTFSHKPQISFEFVNAFQSQFQLNILNDFISFLPKKSFDIRLSGNFMMESSQLIAYTLLKICESGAKLDNAIKDFVKSNKGNKNALCIIRNYNCSHTNKLKGDDPKQFLNAFELSFSLITPQLKHSIQSQFSTVSNDIVNYLLKTMEASISSKSPFPNAHPLLYFLQSIESKSAQNLLNIYKKYRQNMTVKFNNKKIANARKSTVFLRELHIFCGPWFNFNRQNKLHFKIATGFCMDGSRALMKVDNKHDFTKHIASIEDQMRIFSKDANGTQIPAKLLTIKSSYIGNIYTFPDRLVFTGEFAHIKKRKIDISLSDILYVFQRVIPNGSTGIEIFITGIKSYLFEIPQAPVEHLLSFIETNAVSSNYFNYIYTNKYNFFNELIKITGKKVQRSPSSELYKLSGLFEAFDAHLISTYAYIFYLNIIAGRSLNCLMIYPVFPWVIADYTSNEIDLGNPKIYRDFKKPTCLLNDKQLKHNKKSIESGDVKKEKKVPSPHFSNPFIVCGFLKRIEPFGTIDSIINNENEPRRPKSFDSIAETWESVSNDINDNRELTPEFYSNEFIFKESYAPYRPKTQTSAFTSTSNLTQSVTQVDNSFSCFQINYQTQSSLIDKYNEEEEENIKLENETKLELSSESKIKNNDDKNKKGMIKRVILPPWAKGKTSNFIKVNTAALESEYTRRSIHDWIDLMFGIKSQLWFDKADWNIFDINQKSPEFVKKINTTNRHSLYSSDGSLSNNSELITQVYPDFCYRMNLNNQSGSYGICPHNVILEPVPEARPFVALRSKKLQTPANQILRIRKSYAIQSDFRVLNYINCTSAAIQPIQNMKFFEVSEEMDMVFIASPYELYVKAIVFNKANDLINSNDSKSKRRSYSNRTRELTRSSPNLNTNINIDLNVNVNVNVNCMSNINNADENSSNINNNDNISNNNNNSSNFDKEFDNVSEIVINHEAAPISSIAVVKNILISATTDGTIRRWLLPHFVVCRKTNLHYCSVIAIGGSLSLNLLVSMDVFGNVVFESLMNSRFSLCTKLKKVYKTNFIHVFKSGKVAIIQSDQDESCVTLLNMEGRFVNERKFGFCIQEFDSVSNSILLEKLLIGYNSDTIELIDIPSLITNASYHGLIPNMKFSRVKNSNDTVYAFTGTKIELLPLTKNVK